MKRLLKILLGFLGGVIALLLIAILIIVLVVDPNDYKQQIADFVKNTTGRTLTIDGDIHLTFYPWLGLDLGQVSLGNAPGFEEPEFAKVEQAQVRVKLIPLLKQQLEVGTVLLTGTELTLTRKADGQTNWDDLAALGGKSADQSQSKPLEDFKIKGIDLRQAKIVWDDQQAGSRYVFSDMNLKTSTLVLNEPIQVQFNSALNIQGATTLDGQLELNSQITINPENQQYLLEPVQLTATVQSDKFPEPQTLSLNTYINIDLEQQALTLNRLKIQAINATLTGQIQALQFHNKPTLTGKIKLTDLNLRKVLKPFGLLPLPGDPLLKKVALETQFETNMTDIQLKNVDLRVDDNQLQSSQLYFDLNTGMLDSNKLSLHAFGLDLKGQFNIQKLFDQPKVTGQLTLAPFNPREVYQRLKQAQFSLPPISLPQKNLLKTAALETQFQFNQANNEISLNKLQLQIDEHQLKTSRLKVNLAQETLDFDTLSLQAFGFLKLNGQVKVKQLLSQPTVSGQLAVAPFNPRTLYKSLKQQPFNLPALSLPPNELLPLQTVALTTQFQLSEAAQKIHLENLQLQIDDNELKTPQLQLDLKQETLDSNSLSLQAFGMNLQGKVQIKHLLNQPLTRAEIALAPFNPQAVLKRLGQAPLQLPAPFTLTSAHLKTRLSVTSQELTLDSLQLNVDDNQLNSKHVSLNFARQQLILDSFLLNLLGVAVNGHLYAEQVSSQPMLQGSLKIPAFNPRQLLQRLGQAIPETTDPTALTTLALETDWQGSLSQLHLPKIKINLDNSELTGNIGVQNFNQPAIAFNLDLDQFDLDRYLPPKPPAEENQTQSPPPSGEEILLPLEQLRALNLNGILNIKQLTAAHLKMNDIQLAVSAKEGQIKVIPKALLYQGTYRGNLTLDVQQNPPRLWVDEALTEVQASPLLMDLIGDDKISGTATLTAQLSADVINLASLQNTLDGTIRFLFLEGTLKGFNIGLSLRQAKALLKKEPLPDDGAKRTDFSNLQGTFVAKNGVLYNEDLNMKSPLLRATGRGNLVMSTQEIIFGLKVAVVNTSKGQGGKELEDLKGIIIPVKVVGRLYAPSVHPDLGAVEAILLRQTKAAAAARLEQEKQKMLEKNKNKIDEPLMKFLKELDVEEFFK